MNFKSQLEWFYTLPNLVKTNSGFSKIKWQTSNRTKANVIRISKQQQGEAAIARTLYEDLQKAAQGEVVVENWTAFLSRHSEKAAYEVRGMMLESRLISSQESATAVADDMVKAYLEQIGKAIRYLQDRPTLSIDKSVSSEDSTSLSEIIPDDNANNDLDAVEQSSLMNDLTAHAYDYLQQVDPSKWLIWFLKELVDLKQTDVAILIGSTQKTVSLNYRKVWQNFLKATICKFQSGNSTSQELTSETITDLKEGLVDTVKSCFRSSLQDHLRSLPQTSDRYTSQQLLRFLQDRSNKTFTVNPDIEQKLDSFMETID